MGNQPKIKMSPIPLGVSAYTAADGSVRSSYPNGVATAPQPVGEQALPPLPKNGEAFPRYQQFNGDDMRAYARAALDQRASSAPGVRYAIDCMRERKDAMASTQHSAKAGGDNV